MRRIAAARCDQPLCAAESPSDAPRKLRIIVTGGHPGDPEYGCGGHNRSLHGHGTRSRPALPHRGDTEETATRPARPLRGDEGKKACEILGARPAFAGQINAHAIVDEEHYQKFREILEAEKPDAVFTHWPIDNQQHQGSQRRVAEHQPESGYHPRQRRRLDGFRPRRGRPGPGAEADQHAGQQERDTSMTSESRTPRYWTANPAPAAPATWPTSSVVWSAAVPRT